MNCRMGAGIVGRRVGPSVGGQGLLLTDAWHLDTSSAQVLSVEGLNQVLMNSFSKIGVELGYKYVCYKVERSDGNAKVRLGEGGCVQLRNAETSIFIHPNF